MADGKPLTFGALLGLAVNTGVHTDKHGRPHVRRTVNGHMTAIYEPVETDPDHPWLLIHCNCPHDCDGVSGLETHPVGAPVGSRLAHRIVGPWPFLNQWGYHEDWVLEQIDGLKKQIKARQRDNGVTAAKLGIARAELARAHEAIRELRAQLKVELQGRVDG